MILARKERPFRVMVSDICCFGSLMTLENSRLALFSEILRTTQSLTAPRSPISANPPEMTLSRAFWRRSNIDRYSLYRGRTLPGFARCERPRLANCDVNVNRSRPRSRGFQGSGLEHDPEKWTPVFRKIMLKHATAHRGGRCIVLAGRSGGTIDEERALFCSHPDARRRQGPRQWRTHPCQRRVSSGRPR